MNIIELPAGPDLDRLIAEKVMGWTLVDTESGGHIWAKGRPPSYGNRRSCLFSPSKKIDHAWEVVRSMEFVMHLHAPGIWTDSNGWYNHKVWWCCLQKGAVEGMPLFEAEGTAQGDTAPLAICRAALAAVSHE